MSEIPPSQTNFNPPPSSALDLNEWINIWKKALTQPSAATFEELERHPLVTMQNSLIWNAISGAVGGLLGGAVGLLFHKGNVVDILSSAIFGAIGGVVGLLIFASIVYAICKAQGGTGSLQTQVALLGTFVPPLILISLTLAQVTFLGGIVSFFLSIYQLYLYIVATQAAQNVTMGKAAIAVLLPGLLILCCIILATFGLLALLLPWFTTRSALP